MRQLTVTVTVTLRATVKVDDFVSVVVGVGILRQSQALEMAEEARDVSQVGVATSASSARGALRARTAFKVAGGFPRLKIGEVLRPISVRSEYRKGFGYSRRCSVGCNSLNGRSADKRLDGRDCVSWKRIKFT